MRRSVRQKCNGYMVDVLHYRRLYCFLKRGSSSVKRMMRRAVRRRENLSLRRHDIDDTP